MVCMKKFISAALAVCLAAALFLPAAAADAGLDERLTQVTLSVKQTLDIGDQYTDFSGQLTESDPVNQWNLTWTSEEETIYVTATEAGKIVSYYHYYQDEDGTVTSVPFDGSLAKFPDVGKTEAEQTVKAFLDKVLDSSIESADLEEGNNLILRYDDGSYNFYGTLLLNGLETPIYVSVTVDNGRQEVTGFYRGDSGVDYQDLPASAKIDQDAAAVTLFGTVEMQLNYVVSDSDEHHAILRYTPVTEADYVVDALTGELITITPQYYYGYGNKEMASQSAADSASGLTDVELQTVTELAGTLSSAELEAAARNISELKLMDAFTLNSAQYYAGGTDADSSVIYAYLRFVQKSGSTQGDDYTYTEKDIILNAKTGEFVSSSAYGYSNQDPKVNYSRTQCESLARAFAQKYNADELKRTSLSEETQNGNDRYETFTFVRQANSIDFPSNAIYVTVDVTDGSIGGYNVTWDDAMTFADPAGIKTVQQAKDIYTGAAGIGLCYAYVPSGEDESDTTLALVYDFADKSVWGVDAATGQPLKTQTTEAEPYSYQDISGHYAKKQIEKLAEYGIGYLGSSFEPDKALTQKDALTLIVAAGGYTLDQSAEDYEENLYSAAYSMGILGKADRNPSEAVTRAQLTELVVNAAGYGEVAQLKDIFCVSFRDESAIPADLYGYVAIAKGLGVIQGGTDGNFRPTAAATRAHLAIMLYNVMSR